MRTILAFDTATSVTSCALILDGALVAERATDARSLLAATDELLKEAGLTAADLDGLVVGTGPGSFTSIRMGLATARGLAFALSLPVAGVSTLLGFAGGDPVIDAKRGEVFATGPVVASPEELDVAGRRLVGDGAVRYRTVFEAAGAEIPPDDDPDHSPHAHLLVTHAGNFGPAQAVEPTYLRQPDATPKANP
jgi:tRNA threonylcarbamoyladenosine biosynthesis protein TsaB